MPGGPLTLCVLDVKDSSDLGQGHQGYVFKLGGRPCLTQWTPERGYHLVSLPGDLNMKTHKEKAQTHTHIKRLIHAAFFIMQECKMFSSGTLGSPSGALEEPKCVMQIGVADMHTEDFLK